MTAAERVADLERLAREAPEAHEALCTSCGACCFLTVRVGRSALHLTTVRCPYLEGDAPGAYRCAVYADRFARAPWCKRIEAFVVESLAPKDCPYTEGIDGYVGSSVVEGVEAERVEDWLRDRIARGALHAPGLDPADLGRFMARDSTRPRLHLPTVP